ncbi:MAG: hypothetical protein D6726_12430, partial [Nitrospirae bacterium]
QERYFVSTQDLYKALTLYGMEKWGIPPCSYRWFREKVKAYEIPFRVIEVPHPKNRRQFKFMIDITDEPKLIEAVSLIKSKEGQRQELRIKVPEDIYEILEQKANEMKVTPAHAAEIILMRELSDRNKHQN